MHLTNLLVLSQAHIYRCSEQLLLRCSTSSLLECLPLSAEARARFPAETCQSRNLTFVKSLIVQQSKRSQQRIRKDMWLDSHAPTLKNTQRKAVLFLYILFSFLFLLENIWSQSQSKLKNRAKQIQYIKIQAKSAEKKKIFVSMKKFQLVKRLL